MITRETASFEVGKELNLSENLRKIGVDAFGVFFNA